MPTATADWLQEGGDAARTGVAQGEGPAWNDVVFTMPVPVTAGTPPSANPIIVGDTVYFAVPGTLTPSSNTSGPQPGAVVYAVDLRDPGLVEWAHFDWPLYHLASEGERLVATGNYQLVSWPLDGGEPWRSHLGVVPEEAIRELYGGYQGCGPPAVADGVVMLACLTDSPRGDNKDVIVGAYDATNGELVWQRPWDSIEAQRPEPQCSPSTVLDSACYWTAVVGNHPPAMEYRRPAMAVVQDRAYVVSDHRFQLEDNWYSGFSLFAIDVATGTGQVLDHDYGLKLADYIMRGAEYVATPTGNEDWVFTKAWNLRKYSATEPDYHEYESITFRDPTRLDLGSGFALQGERLYAASLTTLFLFDLDLEPDRVFQPLTLPAGEAWDRGGLVVTDDLVLARATRLTTGFEATHTILYAIDARTGAHVWRHVFDGPAQLAVSDGLVVALDSSGMLTVLGQSPVSPQPRGAVSTRYPGIGELVTVDLSRSGPGLKGPVTEYRADWGDGFVSEWQTDATFTHRYAAALDQDARFFVRNDAGQSASVPMTFHVGQADPSVNIFNSPFSDQYQEATFFFLGLLITAILALFGLYRAGRKRRLLERELRSLQALKEEYGDDDEGLQVRLAERRQRAHDLYMDRRLEDGHLQVLERRIDELAGRARLGRIEEECGFLPVGLARSLEGMLRDGRISSRERATFLAAVDEHHALRAGEKAKIRRLIDEWFQHDSGGAP